MTKSPLAETSAIFPLRALISEKEPGVLAVITGVDGPSYRPLGAMMAIFPDNRLAGSLSSGCVEADIALHAEAARQAGRPRIIRYGKGSPFKDIALPCGGGLDILMVPEPDLDLCARLCEAHEQRQATGLSIDAESGVMAITDRCETGWNGASFQISLVPELEFYVFGKGPEASTFAALAAAAGFPVMVLSPDDETLASAQSAGAQTRHLVEPAFPADLDPDSYSAVLLFFHDHEWEPPILSRALNSAAFYIGAQGSKQARRSRDVELMAQGLAPELIRRIRGPIGLVPSARDARSLAVGVLAEVLAARP